MTSAQQPLQLVIHKICLLEHGCTISPGSTPSKPNITPSAPCKSGSRPGNNCRRAALPVGSRDCVLSALPSNPTTARVQRQAEQWHLAWPASALWKKEKKIQRSSTDPCPAPLSSPRYPSATAMGAFLSYVKKPPAETGALACALLRRDLPCTCRPHRLRWFLRCGHGEFDSGICPAAKHLGDVEKIDGYCARCASAYWAPEDW